MFFCPKCNYSLDISKTIPHEISGDIQLKIPKDFIDMFLDNELEGNIKLMFSKKDLLSTKDYKKLSDEIKEDVNKKFIELNSTGYNIAYFICKNCQFITKLNQGTTIYKVSLNSNNNQYEENIDIRNKDNTLPRTKDYICPNNKCNSHKNLLDKEAVFYRPDKNSYRLEYNCSICNTIWDVRKKEL
jgi:hypothetical protein